jgi:hypothetical protein
MSLYLTKYFNASSLNDATTIYDDELLTVVSANGYYSDGVTTRYQLDGVLGSNKTCPTCLSYPCTSGIDIPTDGIGRYNLKTTFGADIGAIKVLIKGVGTMPIGVQLLKDSVPIDNKFSSTSSSYSLIGQINAPIANALSFFSSSNSTSGVCKSFNFSSISLPTYTYSGSNWVTDNVNANINMTNRRSVVQNADLEDLLIYIPKTSATDIFLTTIAVSPCGGTALTNKIEIGCPLALPTFDVSGPQPNANAACDAGIASQLYVGYVSGATVGGDVRISVNDFIFDDANGNIKATDAWYGINRINAEGGGSAGLKSRIQVQDGIVVKLQSCV